MNTKITVREYFQKNFIDSGKVKPNFIEKYRNKTCGHQPQGMPTVVVGDQTFEYNGRRPKPNKCMDNIVKSDGLDWYQFGALMIAETEEGARDLWDTLHRAMMACIVLGPDAKVPAMITPFESGQKIHANFWKVNGGRTKTVTPEQKFIAQIKSEEPEKEQASVHDVLKTLKDVVIFEEKEIFEPIQNTFNWSVNYGPMAQMLKDIQDPEHIKQGFELYKTAFKQTYDNPAIPLKVVGQLVQALVMLCKANETWLANECKQVSNFTHFQNWLTDTARVRQDKYKHWLYKENFHDRMEKRYLGTAVGIWGDFVTYFGKAITKGSSKCTNDAIQKLYNASLLKYKTKEAA